MPLDTIKQKKSLSFSLFRREEPWHFKFLGVAHDRRMTRGNGICFCWNYKTSAVCQTLRWKYFHIYFNKCSGSEKLVRSCSKKKKKRKENWTTCSHCGLARLAVVKCYLSKKMYVKCNHPWCCPLQSNLPCYISIYLLEVYYIFKRLALHWLHLTLRIPTYLSKRWQKLQVVILSKVCILNMWELWLAFAGRTFDLTKDIFQKTVKARDMM